MIIDARCRPATEIYLNSTFGPKGTSTAPFATPFSRFDLTTKSITERSMDAFLEEMEEAGIDYALAPARWSFGNGEVDPLVPAEEVIRVQQTYPKKVYGAIALSAKYLRRSLELIEKHIVNGPIKAACLEPGMEEKLIDDKTIYVLYDYLQDMDIPLFLMSGGGSGHNIDNVNPIHLEKMLGDFPKLTVIGCHASVPYAEVDCFVAFRHKNYFPCPDVYMIDSPWARTYVEGANGMMPEQFLFGTAYPFITMKEAVDKFMKLPFRPEIMDNILYKNAARALKLDLDALK